MSQIFMIVLLLGPLLAVVGMMKIWNFKMQRSGRHFPFKDDVLREPGYSLLKKREEIWEKVSQYLFLLSLYPIVMYATFSSHLSASGKSISMGITVIVALCTILVLIYSFWRIWGVLSLSLDYKLGYAGEVVVGQSLNILLKKGFFVFHDIPFNGFNVDHVAVGPTGVFAIETKARSKRAKGKGSKAAYKVRYNGKELYFADSA